MSAILVAAGLATSQAAAEDQKCRDLLPDMNGAPESRALSHEDILALRDIGPNYLVDHARSLFSLSPDGQSVAFQLHQADAATNSYCVGLVVISIRDKVPPRLLDVGGDLLRYRFKTNGWAALPTGIPLPVTPGWSPDGRWIAFLKRTDGSTQIWKVNVVGGGSRQVTQSPADIEDFRITADGRTIVYSARPGLIEIEAAIDREGRERGWRLDTRAYPISGARPQAPDIAETRYFATDVETGHERPASEQEIALFGSTSIVPANSIASAIARNGRAAWIETADPPSKALRLKAQLDGRTRSCPSDICEVDASTVLWWTSDGKRLRFSRRDGWAGSRTSIFEWRPGKGAPTRLFSTDDALIECQPIKYDLLCLRESSNRPRHLIRLDPLHGTIRILFDPNPEFGSLDLGRVVRMRWRNDFGIKSYGDLVYPVGYRPGNRYPLVVVQYRTHGFLRGGVGDEFPIQAFANRGYFVLSIENQNLEAIVGQRATSLDELRAFTRDFNGRKSLLSSIEVAVRSLIARGLVSEKQVGITGLSDGSSTVQFAALNSDLFAAGSATGCCWEPAQDALLGPVIAKRYHDIGWPSLPNATSKMWEAISLVKNPERVDFPLLLQAADNEYLLALESYTALAQAGHPVDMFIFPDEHHVKWQPAHRRAVYRRNLAWFDFWLKGIVSTDAQGRKEVERWREMKNGIGQKQSASADVNQR